MSKELRTNVHSLKTMIGDKVAVTVLVHAADVPSLRPGSRVTLVVSEPEEDALPPDGIHYHFEDGIDGMAPDALRALNDRAERQFKNRSSGL